MDNSLMTVDKFINILKRAKDTDIAPIEFWVGEKEYELDRVGQFGIMANVTVGFKINRYYSQLYSKERCEKKLMQL